MDRRADLYTVERRFPQVRFPLSSRVRARSHSSPTLSNGFRTRTSAQRTPLYEKYLLEVPVIAKYPNNGDIALGIINFTDERVDRRMMSANRFLTAITFNNLGLSATGGKDFEAVGLWTGGVLPTFNGTLMIDSVEAHACRLFRLKIVDKK